MLPSNEPHINIIGILHGWEDFCCFLCIAGCDHGYVTESEDLAHIMLFGNVRAVISKMYAQL